MGEAPQNVGGLVSVIVACSGSLPRTRRCIDALLRYTRRPWELIAVTDKRHIGAYLAGVGDAAPIHVEIVDPDGDTSSFRHAPGLAVACGDYLVLIDDGIVVSEGWLGSLAGLAEWDTTIGMVGPMLNDAAPPQRAGDIEGFDPAAIREFSDRWREQHRRQWITTDRLSPSCLLLRRRVYESVADNPMRSADDLVEQVIGRGLSLAVIRELFIYHESASAATLEKSPGSSERPPYPTPTAIPVERWPITARTCSDCRKPSTSPRVSLTMIVRDEMDNLPACVSSAEGLCDEVVIVDTGSTDETVEIARSLARQSFPLRGLMTSLRRVMWHWITPQAAMPSGSTPMTG